MNKQQFMERLSYGLSQLSSQDKAEILYDYEEHFRIGLEEGKTEEEIADSLGDPLVIARDFKATLRIEQPAPQGRNESGGDLLRTVLATLSLAFFNLVFVLGPFMAVVGILVGLMGISLGALAAGLSFMFGSLTVFFSISNVGFFFLGLSLFSGGLLLLIGGAYGAKGLFQITVRYLQWNLSVIKGRRAE